MKLYRGLFCVTFVALAGCESPAPTSISDSSFEVMTSRGANTATSGGGFAQLPAGFTLMEFSFNVKSVPGGARGRFHEHYESAGGIVDFTGEATCVSFDPVNNRAWIGGVVTENNSTHPSMLTAIHEVGRDVWFRVVDNGEGNAAAGDRSTVYGFTGAGGITTSAQYCATQPWTAGDVNTWEVVEGNIQVKQ
jgi:hypothetical protein